MEEDTHPPPCATKTDSIYFKVIEATGKIYSDPMGNFVLPSAKGNNYIICIYIYDANYIMLIPMKDHTKASQLAAYTACLIILLIVRFSHTFHILNNTYSGVV